jgi:hypothetical protein
LATICYFFQKIKKNGMMAVGEKRDKREIFYEFSEKGDGAVNQSHAQSGKNKGVACLHRDKYAVYFTVAGFGMIE